MRNLSQALSIIAFVVLTVVSLTATAFAADVAVPEDGSLRDLVQPVYDAIVAGNYWAAAALGVVLMTAAARKYLPDNYGGKFIRSDVGGMLTAFVMAFAGAVGTAFAAPGATMSLAILKPAFGVGVIAIGGFTAIHKLASWLVKTKFYQDKVPAWIKTPLSLLLALIGSSSSAVAKAEKAGDKAVADKPAGGAEAVVGKPTEL